MSSDEDWITEEMDDYFLGSEVEEEYVDPDDYSYVDPETGLTPKQEAYLAYKEALELYNWNWVGTPWWARTEDPPRWEDFWQEPVYVQPRQTYRPTRQSSQTSHSTRQSKKPNSKKSRPYHHVDGEAVVDTIGGILLILFCLGCLVGFVVLLIRNS